MKRSNLSKQGLLARRPDSRDEEVGRRVRSKRLESSLSQTELADRIGVTFQQVQKYEKGTNRIGAGRLQRIAEAFGVPITFFFDAPPSSSGPRRTSSSSDNTIFGLMQNTDAVRIVKAFHKIPSREARQLLVGLAEEFAEG